MPAMSHVLPRILDGLAIGVVAASIHHKTVVYANQAFCRLTGYSLAQLQQMPLVELHPAAVRQALAGEIDDVIAGAPAHQWLFPVQCADGRQLFAKIQTAAVDVSVDSILIASYEDISQQLAFERNLQLSEERLRLALRAAEQGLYDLDIPTGQATVSPEYALMIGYDPAHFVESHAAWFARLHPDDQPRVLTAFNNYLGGKSAEYRVEFRQRTAHGQWKWILSQGKILEWLPSGEPKRMLGTHTDIDHQKQLEQQLLREQSLLKTLLAHLPALVWLKDPAGRYLSCNARFEQLFGCSERDIIGRVDTDFVDAATAQLFRHHDELAIREQRKVVNEEWLTFKADGHRELAETHKVPLTMPDGTLVGVLGIAHDITARYQSEQQLSLAASVFSAALEGIMITDLNGVILQVNDAFCGITGFQRADVIGQNARILNSGRQAKTFHKALWQSLQTNLQWSGEIVNRRRSGELFSVLLHISTALNHKGQPSNYVAVFSDISALKAQQHQLERMAHFDVLTSLPNRVLLEDRLRQSLQQARRTQRSVAVVFIDLDGFKAINDRFGHPHGDQVLVQLAARLKQALRRVDTLARIGGDEFVAVLPDLVQPMHSMAVLERLLDAAAKLLRIDGIEVRVSASLGVAFADPNCDCDADLLIRQADQAMYQAKLAGKNRFCWFDPKTDNDIRHRFELLNELREALENDQFELFYQPQIELRTGRLISVEALIRWRHPVRGLLLPAEFLPVLSQHPLAVQLGDWVLLRVLAQLERWNQQGRSLRVSINIDSQQLNDLDFMRRVSASLALYPTVSAQQLEFEVLETGALDNLRHVSELITSLQTIGLSCALDDFGTGYSSLTFLKQLPARTIKIDQSFVTGMLEDAEQLVIVDSVLQLARRFGRRVVAEGVTTERHGQLLVAMGCDFGQGFGIAAPMPEAELWQWLACYKAPTAWVSVPKLPSDGVQALIAAVEHMQWFRQQRLLLAQAGRVNVSLHGQCRLSRWLESSHAHHAISSTPVTHAHRQLHQTLNTLAEREQRSDDELSQLDGLAAQLSATVLTWLWQCFAGTSLTGSEMS